MAAASVGCISTPQGKQFGVPGIRDTVVSRYERPMDQVINSAREVLSRTGTITGDDVVNNAISAKIDNRSVWVSAFQAHVLIVGAQLQLFAFLVHSPHLDPEVGNPLLCQRRRGCFWIQRDD